MKKAVTTIIMLIIFISTISAQGGDPYFIKSWTDSISRIVEGKEYTVKYLTKKYDVGRYVTFDGQEPDHSNPSFCLWTISIPTQNFETLLKFGAIEFTDIRDNDGTRRGQTADDLLVSWHADPSILGNTKEFELASFKNCILNYKCEILLDEELQGQTKEDLTEAQNISIFKQSNNTNSNKEKTNAEDDFPLFNNIIKYNDHITGTNNNSNNSNNSNKNTKNPNKFTDSRDGHEYKTVKIGNQTWMTENFAYNSGYGCKSYDNNSYNVTTYGYLYSFKVAQNVCPDGWKLPSKQDYQELLNSDGNSTNDWTDCANNYNYIKQGGNSGFNAQFSGIWIVGSYSLKGSDGCYWTSTTYDYSGVYFFTLFKDGKRALVAKNDDYSDTYYSVRCIKQ